MLSTKPIIMIRLAPSPPNLKSIPDGHVNRVCQPGTTVCCRYLVMGAKGFECTKGTPMGKVIDGRVEQMNAQGDNCDGNKDIPAWKGDA